MDSVQEEWRPIPGFEGFYEASSLGRIRSLDRVSRSNGQLRKFNGRVLSQGVSPQKYPVVVLSVNGKSTSSRVHNLIASAFYCDKRPDYVVNHIDGDKSNNRPDNLEWVTHSQNTTFAAMEARRTRKRRSLGPRTRTGPLTADDVLDIRRLAKSYRLSEIARHFGLHRNTVTRIVHGRTWRHLLPEAERGGPAGIGRGREERYPPRVAIRKKVVAVGGTSKGIILTKDAQELLGLSGGNDVVLLEFIGDTMLVRREGAPPLTPAQLQAGFAGLEITTPTDSMNETTQRILLALAEGPLTVVEIAERVNRGREAITKAMRALLREGAVAKSGSRYSLP